MQTLSALILWAALLPSCSGATLAYSTYLRDGLIPAAITSDPQGDLYLAGSAVIDPQAQTFGAIVAKLNPQASQYLYLTYLDSDANDQIAGITVDSASNVYVTGSTVNPNFPVTGGALTGTAPTGPTDPRSFVTKLSPTGVVLFSVLIGGSSPSAASGIAITPQAEILVSGLSVANGFPVTPGAVSVPNTAGEWFLVELDPTASKVLFSATGIGGSSIVLDSAGNIYLAGSSINTDYPTTPGAYQTVLPEASVCYGLCQIDFPGLLQHVTKVDPTGSKLIYSTGLNASRNPGSTVNTGLAVDEAGNAYVTGTLFEAQYPLTVPNPSNVAASYLTKLDPSGSSLLFSIPVGGAGLALDPSGELYSAGTISFTYSFFPGPGPLPIILPEVLSWLPQQCLPNNLTGLTSSYVMKVDPGSGSVQDAQWIDGAGPTAVAVTLTGGKVWTTGFTPYPDVPFSVGALTTRDLEPGPLPGAFLSAVDFSQPSEPAQNGAPVIACVLDAGNFTHAGPVAAYQILSIFGANLGPVAGTQAPDGTDPSIAGVTVTFDGNPAEMTYVSSSQINVMIPAPAPLPDDTLPIQTVMQVSVNGATLQRQLPLTAYNLNIFADTANGLGCPGQRTAIEFVPLALNFDGSRNSCANPAQAGSLLSVFVHGVGVQQLGAPMPITVGVILAQLDQCTATVENVALVGLVYRVDIRLPATLLPCAYVETINSVNFLYSFLTLTYNGSPAGPFFLNTSTVTGPPESQLLPVWLTQ